MLRNIKLILVLFLLFFSLAPLFSNQTDVISITKSTTSISLYDYIEILEDKENKLTINDLLHNNYAQEFKPTSIVQNSFGFTSSSFWVRFSTSVDHHLDDILYLELDFPQLDYVTLYTSQDDDTFSSKISGELVDNNFKDVQYRKYLFRLLHSAHEKRTYYLHIQSTGSVQVPLRLITSSALIEEIDISNFILGGYYGNMLLLMLAAFIAFIKIRDYMFLTYSIYILSYLLFQLAMNGFLAQILLYFPFGYSNNISALTVAFVVFGGALFSGSFLQIWSGDYPKIRLLYYALITTAICGVLLAFFYDFSMGIKIATIAGVSLPPIVLFSAVYTLYKGYKPAKFFLAAWGIFLFGIFSSGLLFLGFLPHTFLTAYSMQIGSTLELLLLSYALIVRLNNLVKEKDIATKNAANYLTQINEGLESLVEERTQELEEKNTLLHDLANRDGMTALYNHRASLEKLNSMIQTAKRYEYKLCVIMMDIDFFKVINDTFGHQAGDIVILKIANIIKKNVRQSDVAGRYGGEEFILILHDATLQTSVELADRIRMQIASLKIPEIRNTKVTMSFGISKFDNQASCQELLREADVALYAAKEQGRNRIITSNDLH